MSVPWLSKIGDANSQPMTPPQRATPLGGITSTVAIDAPTIDDATAGLAAYGYRGVSARFQVSGGTSASFQLWAFCEWFGFWYKVGAAIVVLADATAGVEFAQVNADRLHVAVAFTGDPDSVTVQLAGFTPNCE